MTFIRNTFTPVQQMFAVFAIFALVAMSINGMFSTAFAGHSTDPINTEETAYSNPSENIRICHTGSGKTYTSNSPSADSIVKGTSGHGDQHSNDIIPPFWHILNESETPELYHGRNWTEANSEIWENNCVKPADPSYIVVKKLTVGGDGTEEFEFTGDITATLTSDNSSTPVEVSAGTYTVTETPKEGWTLTGISCDQDDSRGNLDTGVATYEVPEGQTVTCTFTNTKDEDPQPTTGTLVVKKVVSGGDATASDFSFQVNGETPIQFEADGENVIADLTPDTYTVTEPAVANYTPSYDNCDTVAVTAGATTTCTITNTYDAPAPDTGSITVRKEVVSNETDWSFDFSGTNGLGDFQLTNTAQTEVFTNLAAGTYAISESVPQDWKLDAECVYDDEAQSTTSPDNIVLTEGDNVLCLFVNTDTSTPPQPTTGTLTVIKQVVNGENGTATSGDFTLFVDQTEVVSGEANEFATGTYTVSESEDPDYTASFSGDCNAEGLVTLAAGDTKTCTITNTYNDIPTYLIDGYVWHDANEDGIFDDNEDPLQGWSVHATDGDDSRNTTSNEDGYYSFMVPAGTWKISETVQAEWSQTFPSVVDEDGVHVVTVPFEGEGEGDELSLSFPLNLIFSVAHAQVAQPQFNFGNVFVGGGGNTTTSTGGGGGRKIEMVDPDGIVGNRSSDTDGEVAGASDSREPIGEVLGEQVSVVPVGAPNTGAGGAAPTQTVPALALLAMIGALATMRATRMDTNV